MVVTAGFLTLAAFLLSVIAIIVSAALRRQLASPEDEGIQNTERRDAAADVPQIFATALAASQMARSAKLSRRARTQAILTPVLFALCGFILIFALAAFFLAGDRKAATVCTLMATISLGFTTTTYLSAKHARQKAIQ